MKTSDQKSDLDKRANAKENVSPNEAGREPELANEQTYFIRIG